MGITGEKISMVFVTRMVHLNMAVIFNCYGVMNALY